MDNQERQSIEAACHKLIIQLTHLVDDHSAKEATSLFANDGTWIRGGKTFRGQDEILGSFAGSGQIQIRHVVSNISVEPLTSSSATGRSYYVLFRHDAESPDLPMPMQLPFSMGEWHDEFTLVDGRWRFAFREVKRLFQRTGA